MVIKSVKDRSELQFDDMSFDSKAELSCYKKLISEYGKENVKKEPKSFLLSEKTDHYNTIVFRSWGKSLSSRAFPHDRSNRVFTPDFIVTHKGLEFIVEFKNAFRQSADYPLRRTIFLRSEQAKGYSAYFETKSQAEVREAIYKINNIEWQK